MRCVAGNRLLQAYRQATEERAVVKDAMLSRIDGKDRVLFAKQKHSDTFMLWVTHRCFCIECRAISEMDDVKSVPAV